LGAYNAIEAESTAFFETGRIIVFYGKNKETAIAAEGAAFDKTRIARMRRG
jgi:hypothetical protein